jgi:hypothetical protein
MVDFYTYLGWGPFEGNATAGSKQLMQELPLSSRIRRPIVTETRTTN